MPSGTLLSMQWAMGVDGTLASDFQGGLGLSLLLWVMGTFAPAAPGNMEGQKISVL